MAKNSYSNTYIGNSQLNFMVSEVVTYVLLLESHRLVFWALFSLVYLLMTWTMVKTCNLTSPYLFADDGALLFENICRITYLSIRAGA